MAVYFVTGKLGSGKTLCCIGKIRDYLQQGRRVATNLDLNIQALTSYDSKTSVVRVPDKPTRWDLDALGQGCDESDESKYGLLVLDELGTWFNCRNWQDKGRLAVIDWFLHARKKHWDIYLIVQSIESLDSQLVNALCEHLVICKRTDRLNIPFISPVLKFMEFGGKLPKFHIAKVYYGQDVSGMLVDRWIYRAHDLYPCYNTDQIFTDNSDGLSTVLPAYYKNNLGLIEYHKKQIQQLTNKKSKSVITDRQKYALSVVTLAILVLAFVFMSVDRLTNFHPKLFSPAVASSKPSSLPSSIPIAPVPAQNQSVNLVNTSASKVLPHSERWRVSAVVRNNVTKKYVVTVADRDGHMKTLRDGVCVFDTHNQPSCAIDGEVIDLFTGAYSEEKKNDKQKLDVFATAVK